MSFSFFFFCYLKKKQQKKKPTDFNPFKPIEALTLSLEETIVDSTYF